MLGGKYSRWLEEKERAREDMEGQGHKSEDMRAKAIVQLTNHMHPQQHDANHANSVPPPSPVCV